MSFAANNLIESEFARFIDRHARALQPTDLESLMARLPAMRVDFPRFASADYPDLPAQLEFLAQVIEDCAAGLNEGMPRAAETEAAFALEYCYREDDFLPDDLPAIGLLDDALVVNLVLRRNERAYRGSARRGTLSWPMPAVHFDAVLAGAIRDSSSRRVVLPAD